MAFALPRFRKGNLHAIRPGAVPGANMLLTWNCIHTPGWPPSHAHPNENLSTGRNGDVKKRHGATPCTIDNTRKKGYNKDKGNTVGRRLALVSSQKMTATFGVGRSFFVALK